MKNLLKPLMAVSVMGLGALSTQAHATYATFVTSGDCNSPCRTTEVSYQEPVAYTSTRVVTTVITSTVVSRPRSQVRYANAGYCPPKRQARSNQSQPFRDGRRYYREPGFIW